MTSDRQLANVNNATIEINHVDINGNIIVDLPETVMYRQSLGVYTYTLTPTMPNFNFGVLYLVSYRSTNTVMGTQDLVDDTFMVFPPTGATATFLR